MKMPAWSFPLGKAENSETSPSGLGAAIQYLGTNSINAYNESGVPEGTFTAAFAAYSLAYGRKITDTLSWGLTSKFITEKISDATAKAYATDLGLMAKPTPKLSVGAVLANLGSEVKFVDEADPLPLAGRVGATYQMFPQWDFSSEVEYRKTGLFSGGLGVEWRYGDYFSFRGGYNTSHTKELGAASGVTAGLGIFLWGQEFSYAWVPLGDLGQTNYFSLVLRWDTKARPERPRLHTPKEKDFDDDNATDSSSYRDIFDFLNEDEKKSAQ